MTEFIRQIRAITSQSEVDGLAWNPRDGEFVNHIYTGTPVKSPKNSDYEFGCDLAELATTLAYAHPGSRDASYALFVAGRLEERLKQDVQLYIPAAHNHKNVDIDLPEAPQKLRELVSQIIQFLKEWSPADKPIPAAGGKPQLG